MDYAIETGVLKRKTLAMEKEVAKIKVEVELAKNHKFYKFEEFCYLLSTAQSNYADKLNHPDKAPFVLDSVGAECLYECLGFTSTPTRVELETVLLKFRSDVGCEGRPMRVTIEQVLVDYDYFVKAGV